MNFGLRLVAKTLMLIAAFAAMGALREHDWPLGFIGALTISVVLSFVAILIHELSHAAAAWWQGAEVLKIVVLPFELRIRPRKFGWAGSLRNGDIGGYVSYHLDRIGAHRRHAIIAAAGPVGNIVTGALAGVLAAALDTGRRGVEGEPIAPVLAAAFTIVSISAGLANLIPFDQSDGMHIWRYFRRFSAR